MKKVSMSLHEFYEMERGNISLKEITGKNNSGFKICKIPNQNVVNLCLTTIIMSSISMVPKPIITLPNDPTTIELTKEGLHVLYTTSVICLEYLYVVVTSLASTL